MAYDPDFKKKEHFGLHRPEGDKQQETNLAIDFKEPPQQKLSLTAPRIELTAPPKLAEPRWVLVNDLVGICYACEFPGYTAENFTVTYQEARTLIITIKAKGKENLQYKIESAKPWELYANTNATSVRYAENSGKLEVFIPFSNQKKALALVEASLKKGSTK